jgi:hypothetical protein
MARLGTFGYRRVFALGTGAKPWHRGHGKPTGCGFEQCAPGDHLTTPPGFPWGFSQHRGRIKVKAASMETHVDIELDSFIKSSPHRQHMLYGNQIL